MRKLDLTYSHSLRKRPLQKQRQISQSFWEVSCCKASSLKITNKHWFCERISPLPLFGLVSSNPAKILGPFIILSFRSFFRKAPGLWAWLPPPSEILNVRTGNICFVILWYCCPLPHSLPHMLIWFLLKSCASIKLLMWLWLDCL